MTVWVAQWAIDVTDVEAQARFWSQALGYRIEMREAGCAKLVPPDDAPLPAPTVWLQTTPEGKRAKNRTHPDLRPDDGDVEAAVERLVALGARHVDVGQSADDPFVVLADPEGNEFCVLRHPTQPGAR